MHGAPPLQAGRRPVILTVAAVCSIVIGALFLLTSLSALLLSSVLPSDPASAAMEDATRSHPLIHVLYVSIGFTSDVASALLLAAGIGLLRCREWARKAVLGWSFYNIISTLAATWIVKVWIVPAVEAVPQSDPSVVFAGDPDAMGSILRLSLFFGLFLGLGTSIALLWMVCHPKTKTACS